MQIQLNILDSKSADKARTFKLLVIKICLTMAWYDPIRIGIAQMAQPTHKIAGQGRRNRGQSGGKLPSHNGNFSCQNFQIS